MCHFFNAEYNRGKEWRYRGGWMEGWVYGWAGEEVKKDGCREGLNGRGKNGDAEGCWREGDNRREENGDLIVWWSNEVGDKKGNIRGWVERWGE
jgi:hypothetical protein